MEGNSTGKVFLLLQPARLLHRVPVLQLLKVEKNQGLMQMEELPVNSAIINLHAKKLDSEARKNLLKFSEAELHKEKLAIELRFEKQKAETDFDKYHSRQMARYYLQALGQLKQYNQQLSWYHRLPVAATNRVVTAPCTYHPLSVLLEFQLSLTEGQPVIMVWVLHGKQRSLLESFRRYFFLLEQDNTYWHLTLKSYEALEWLEEVRNQFDGGDVRDYLRLLGEHLRQEGHNVLMEEIEEANTLQVLPQRRVRLSELNNAFLMLTPQFVYEGHVMDGPFEPTTRVMENGQPVLIERNKQEEDGLMQYLQGLHPNFSRQLNGYFYLSFADAQKKGWFLKVYHQLLEMDVELLGMDMLKHFKYSPYKAFTQFEVKKQEDDWLHIAMQVMFGKEQVPLAELQKMLLNGQKAVLLKDGSLGVLGEEWLKQYAFIIKHSKVQKGQLLAPRWLAMGEQSLDDTEVVQMRKSVPDEWWNKWKRWNEGAEDLYEVPTSLQNAVLRHYQLKGFAWLCLLAEAGGSACLADDMGLGKTLQTIAYLLHRLQQLPAARHLVVCPASLMYNWQQELERFAPGVRLLVYHGAGRQANALQNDAIQVFITSYGTVRQDINHFSAVLFDTIVADESHSIKNPQAQVTRAMNELRSLTRIALSGTPVMNGPTDLYAQLNFLLPGMLGSREFFRREYAYPIEQQRDEEKAQALQKIIAPFVLRRTKEQVAPDLPAKVESVIWCHMDQDQRFAYESIKEKVRGSVLLDIERNGLEKGKLSVLAGLMKLRQACNSCELVKDEDVFVYNSVKTEVLLDELKGIVHSHKALVFSQFTGMLNLLERDLQVSAIPHLRLDGSTPAQERQKLVDRFQDPDGKERVFLISLKAGNAGLNLTAADYVFLFDPWWNVAVENQAIDRTHRIGQQQHVFAYRLVCKNTVEEKIMLLKERKGKLAADLVSVEDGFLKTLNMEDIAYLLQ